MFLMCIPSSYNAEMVIYISLLSLLSFKQYHMYNWYLLTLWLRTILSIYYSDKVAGWKSCFQCQCMIFYLNLPTYNYCISYIFCVCANNNDKHIILLVCTMYHYRLTELLNIVVVYNMKNSTNCSTFESIVEMFDMLNKFYNSEFQFQIENWNIYLQPIHGHILLDLQWFLVYN